MSRSMRTLSPLGLNCLVDSTFPRLPGRGQLRQKPVNERAALRLLADTESTKYLAEQIVGAELARNCRQRLLGQPQLFRE